jgi:hypothetical protein
VFDQIIEHCRESETFGFVFNQAIAKHHFFIPLPLAAAIGLEAGEAI